MKQWQKKPLVFIRAFVQIRINKMKNILIITNIPAPYRQKMFNSMSNIFTLLGLSLKVLYMAKKEPNRKWKIKQETYQYHYKFYWGLHPIIGNMFAHFNPGLLLRLIFKRDYQAVILGGMASPTHWLVPFFVKRNAKKFMWVESNLTSVKRTKGLSYRLKNLLLSKQDGFVITGNPQKEYIRYFLPEIGERFFFILPNIIDESLFYHGIRKIRKDKHQILEEAGVSEDCQMWILPGQFIEKKGILEFLDLLSISDISNVKLFLLGDGILRPQISKRIQNFNIPVEIIGFVQQEVMLRYYAAADLFILPSLSDPSPLSPIEAIASGLPILVSSKIGNCDDVLDEGQNGWSYDPITEKDKGAKILKKLAESTVNQRNIMGVYSSNIYKERFDTDKLITDFSEKLKKFV